MNLPADYVHDINRGFCWLIVPLFRGRWLAWQKRGARLVVVSSGQFHNCSLTRVY